MPWSFRNALGGVSSAEPPRLATLCGLGDVAENVLSCMLNCSVVSWCFNLYVKVWRRTGLPGAEVQPRHCAVASR